MLADWPRESRKESGMATEGPHIDWSHLSSLLNEIHVLDFPFQIDSICLFMDVLTFHLYEYYSFDLTHLVLSSVVYFLCIWSQKGLEEHHRSFINLYLHNSMASSPGAPHILFFIHILIKLICFIKSIHSHAHSDLLSIRELKVLTCYSVK